MEIVGVVGAGTMGMGVSQNFAMCGYKVILVDISYEILERARTTISENIRFQSFFKKDEKMDEMDIILSRITFSTEIDLLENCSFIIENVPEKIDIKRSVYEKIDSVCGRDCIFMANTSCISITQIASMTKRPQNIIGTHFMNPVPLKTTVEVIKGYHTSEETLIRIRNLLAEIGKECIVVNDYPGFVSNRISHLFINEAAFVVQDKVASHEEVDDIFKKCFGHKIGPLETADLIGLDTIVDSLKILYESYQDPKFKCCPLLKKMVDAGLLGRKSGKGFYNYEP